ncbi:uncharacterized protein LOC131957330 [Physella acuta]|uniref:uncharacterized protein LOC131957330 n=1 Tax=Physella acuta TaxID=109671 RepID=UPI0027DE2233|nr:uncharacterized protein LOC131957330 [Physella acuta]
MGDKTSLSRSCAERVLSLDSLPACELGREFSAFRGCANSTSRSSLLSFSSKRKKLNSQLVPKLLEPEQEDGETVTVAYVDDGENLITNVDDVESLTVADVDDGENLTIADVDEAEIAEEIVVTVDVTTSNEDVTHTSDSLNDSLATIQTTVTVPGGHVVTEDITESDRPSSAFVFKDSNFVHSSKGIAGNKRTRVWKNLKQIVAAERALQWGPDDVTYGSIDAPPSFRPAKKYSDISGLEAKYTDPRTKMRYANSDEYRRVHLLPNDIITGCLQLRKANTLMP